jgi:diguanylate cyclase (GGDEF)-like protein
MCFGRSALARALPLLALLLLACPIITHAAQVNYQPDVPITGPATVSYLRDPGGSLDVATVVASPQRFQPVHAPTVNFGFTGAAYWLHWPLDSRSPGATTVYLSVNQPTLDDVRLYVYSGGVLRLSERAGDRLTAAARGVSTNRPVFAIPIQPGQHYELYLRVASRMGAVLVPMQFLTAGDLAASVRRALLLNGIYTGVFVTLFLYNLFLWAALRQSAYLWYVLTLISAYLAATVLDGFGPWMLYPGLTWPSNQGLVVFAGACFCTGSLFTRALLGIASIRWLDRLLCSAAALAALTALAPWWLPAGWTYPLVFSELFAMPLVQALAGLIALRRDHPQARFFVLAQAASWTGTLGYALIVAGVLRLPNIGRVIILLGSCAEALLLSLALADRIRALQLAAWRAESTTRRVLETRQLELERGVEERTRELDEARRRAEHLATTDALTGVFNRRGLLPRLQQAIANATAQGSPLSLISFDLDQFKRINDEFGHAEGDRVLCQLVQLTRQLVRATDLLGRIGGEEFMLMVSAPRDQAVQLAERLRLHLETHLTAGPQQLPVSASFGVVTLDRRLASLEALQLAADAALYRAKNRGRNRVETYDPAGNETTRSRAILRGGPPLELGVAAQPDAGAGPVS